MWWIWHGTKRLPTLRPGQMTRAASPPAGCQKQHPPSPFIIITQPESWYSFYHPMEERWLSRPRHCSEGVQPVPKAIYCSCFYNNMQLQHNVVLAQIIYTSSRYYSFPAPFHQKTQTCKVLPCFTNSLLCVGSHQSKKMLAMMPTGNWHSFAISCLNVYYRVAIVLGK